MKKESRHGENRTRADGGLDPMVPGRGEADSGLVMVVLTDGHGAQVIRATWRWWVGAAQMKWAGAGREGERVRSSPACCEVPHRELRAALSWA